MLLPAEIQAGKADMDDLTRGQRIARAARYDEAGQMLPDLIRRVEIAARTCANKDARAIGMVRAQVYQATAMVLNRVGETGLAWTAGDRAMTAAEHADAGLLAAASAFRLAHVFAFTRSPQPSPLATPAPPSRRVSDWIWNGCRLGWAADAVRSALTWPARMPSSATMRRLSTCSWPPNRPPHNWSVTTQRPTTSSPPCYAGSIAPAHRSCGRWLTALG
jgi:hypothetical protein